MISSEMETHDILWWIDQERESKKESREKVADWKRIIGRWGIERRREYVSGRLLALKDYLDIIYRKYADFIRDDLEAIEKRMYFWIAIGGYDILEEIEKLSREAKSLDALLRRSDKTDEISEADIERARAYPIANLMEVNRHGYAICPFHDDKKPSFWTRKGYGYCFSCGTQCDSIGYLMRVKGFTFVDAVKRLNSI